VETDPSITVRSAVVEAVNGALHIGLVAVRVIQSLVLVPIFSISSLLKV
jgi:hypothetical protein